jgi:uncharacterized protein (TIGR04255 family)
MATRNKRIPAKLKDDAIVEAVLEVRFDMTTIPEVLLGRLADCPSWKGFEQGRMPTYEIPAFLRQADPNLRYQPVFELHNAEKNRTVRIGDHVLSYHRLAPTKVGRNSSPSWTQRLMPYLPRPTG